MCGSPWAELSLVWILQPVTSEILEKRRIKSFKELLVGERRDEGGREVTDLLSKGGVVIYC